jgi:putative hydrolase of the HAD superfamily
MKLFIFDVDGVLINEERILVERRRELMRAIAKKYKIGVKEAEELMESKAKQLSEKKKHTTTYKFINMGFTRKDFFRALNRVKPDRLIKPYPNCKKMLEEVSKKNVAVVYSNTGIKATKRTLKYIKVIKHIRKIFSSEMFNESKPSVGNLKKILKVMKFKPKDALFIGNSVHKDIMPAKKLGMTTILFDPEGKDKTNEADYNIRDLKEILSI